MRKICSCGETSGCVHGNMDREIVFGYQEQCAIADWAEETFGPVKSNASHAARANTEMAELLARLTSDDNDPEARWEIADIVIVLTRLAYRLGSDMAEDIHTKMIVNRQRQWDLSGGGHGTHKQGTKLVEGTWSWALKQLEAGKKIGRINWNNLDIFIKMDSETTSRWGTMDFSRHLWKHTSELGQITWVCNRWTPDYDDFISADWRIVE